MKFDYLKKALAAELEEEKEKYHKAFNNKAYESLLIIMERIQKLESALLEMIEVKR